MMWKLLKTTITILIISALQQIHAQQLRSLGYSHAITQAASKMNKVLLKYPVDTIHFNGDFFEDFSTYHYENFPRNNHWADNYAFINSCYADSMISLGVATLDAYNNDGYPYYSLSNKIVPSDSLTSQPFAFPDPLDSRTMYFSFFFQADTAPNAPQGITSELKSDTLLLDFYYVGDSTWINVFYTLDNTLINTFKQEIIEVPDSFLQDGFRFRFRNYTSLPQSILPGTDPGQLANDDMWHIDYIQMRQADNAAELEKLNDLTITEPLKPFLKEYTRVPWHHYSMAQPIIESSYTPLAIKTYFPDETNSFDVQRTFTSIDNVAGEVINNHSSTNAMAGIDNAYWVQIFSSGLNYRPTEYGAVEMITYVHCDLEDNRPENDTAKRRELYYDYYAYDDGTAESSFGMEGDDANKRFAMRFRAFRQSTNPDSLYAVLVYFAKSVDSATVDYEYKLSIRKNDGAMPSNEILYESEETLTPDYSVGINEFTRIELDPPIVISDTFFVVIEQINGYLNIGYDMNNDNRNKIFKYTYNEWSSLTGSFYAGSLMIRPSFKPTTIITEVETPKNNTELKLYPNPVSDELFFSSNDILTEPVHIQIYNTMGILVHNAYSDNQSVSVTHLIPGIYFIRISNNTQTLHQTLKFIKE